MHTATMTAPAHLPYDVERTILEYAAASDRPMALTLMLVSREVRRWIEPILYRHITLSDIAQADAFIRTLDSPHSRSPTFFSNTIKSLSFTYGITFHQAARILATCTSATSLATRIEVSRNFFNFSLDDISDFRSFMTTSSPALKRLSVTLQPFFLCPDPDFRVPIFQNLTHLSIFGSSETCYKWSWTGLDTLKHLTHLGLEIDTATPLQAIYNLIPRLPPLLRTCLVILSVKDGKMPLGQYLVDNKEVQQLISGETDQRIVVGTTEPLEGLDSIAESCQAVSAVIPVTRWEDVFGDRTTWEKAEEVVRSRTRKPYTAAEIN
ncbi:hypothetical protein NP233_g6631 [Leucocoprinus birnbaumii]|uniref:Uncharacterized protein n=1 Tax=Leucocoprinus birnbaumii TaxID=56174 RepID=A0AAD5VQN7_9AGAR|nr:hypothetical protein NP233_g6631 [Leucocoprinus birnbaumii]